MEEEYFDYNVRNIEHIFVQFHLQLIPFSIYYIIELNLIVS